MDRQLQLRRTLALISVALTSRKFTIALMLLFLLPLLLAALLPDIEALPAGEAAKTRVSHPLLSFFLATVKIHSFAGSPFFLVISGLLALSTVACTFNRLRARLKRGDAPEQIPGGRVRVCAKTRAGRHEVVSEIRKNLAKAGYKPAEEASGCAFIGRKGEAGFWGSVAFHAGLALLFVAAAISSRYRFSGALLLTERNPVSVARDSFLHISSCGRGTGLPEATLELIEFTASFSQKGEPLDYNVALDISENGRMRSGANIKVNSPLRLHGLQFNLHRYGIAPLFRVKTPGKSPIDGVVNLDLLRAGATDSFDLPETGLTMKVRYKTNRVAEWNRLLPPSDIDSGLEVSVAAAGKDVYKGLVRPGMTFQAGTHLVSLVSYRYWVHLEASKDPGLRLMIAGMLACILGLLFRFFFVDKQVRISIPQGENGVVVEASGCSRYYPGFFENELRSLLARSVERRG